MRILHVIASVSPIWRGPLEGVLQQAAHPSCNNYEIHIASLDDPSSPYVQSCPVKVHALGAGRTKPIGWRRYLPGVHYGYAPRLLPWLRTHIHDYDVVVVNGLWNYATFGARCALTGSGMPYVVFTHGMLDPWFRKAYPLKNCAKQLVWWFCEGPLLNNASAVLFTTEEEKILAHNAFWPYRVKEEVVGYGTNDIVGDAEAQMAVFHTCAPSLNGRPYFLFLSRIHPKKGCDLLIDAFAQIALRHPEYDLVIAGPDQMNWRGALEERACALGVASRIHWPGMLTGDAKWGAYRGAEAFVLPSHQENFGIVVAEAMAAGRPVLITDKVNTWREVKASGGGFVETDDAAGITRLLQRFLAQTLHERVEMGQLARKGFIDYFNLDQGLKSIDRVLMEAVREQTTACQ